MGLAVAILLGLGISARSIHAQEKIVGVDVEGNRGIEKAVILNEVHFSSGDRYDRAKVSEDIVRIYKLGYFEDVQVQKVPSGDGIKLVYVVKEKPPIDEIVVEGNKKVKSDKIRDLITVKPNLPPDNQKIQESIQAIKEYYSKEGFDRATIQTQSREKGGKRQLVFEVRENEGTVVREVNFEGNTVFSDRKLRGMIRTKKKGFLSFLTGSGKFREDVMERDVAVITYNYLNKGYMRVRVGAPKVEFSDEKEGLLLTFYIDEGQRYRVGDITFEGEILTTEQEMLKLFSTIKGNYYSQKIMEDDLSSLVELYGNQGYAFANIVPQPSLNDDTLTTDIRIAIDKGQKVFVEKINITGNTITRDKVIRRELRVVENSLYNEKLIKLSKLKLEQLGFFENVEISTPRGSADDRLVLNINVKEKPTGTFSVGAGYSSSESFLFTASVSKNNFWGLGISGSLSGEISGRRQLFSFQYTDPYFLDTRWIFSANGFRLVTDFIDFERSSFGGGVELGRRLFDFTSMSIGYRIEDVTLGDFDVLVPEFFQQNSDGLTSSAVFQIRRDTRNNPIITTKGTYNALTAEYAGLGGTISYVRLVGNSRFFYPLWGSSVIKANVRVGWIKSLDGDPVPLFERFFTGGVNSLRGFEFRSVGPAITIPDSITGEDMDFVYGGNKLLVMNLEYEFPIYDPAGFRGVIFVDGGNAYAEEEALNPLNIRADFGVGVRWLSPFGPLRFEWGFPFTRKPGEDRSVFNFTIGSFF